MSAVNQHKHLAITGKLGQDIDASTTGSGGKPSDEVGMSHAAPAVDGSTGREQARGKIEGSESTRA